MPQQQGEQKQSDDSGGGLVFDKFAGVNTATTRPGVPDEQAYWFDGFMPLAPRNLRTLPGIGSALYTAPGGLTIVFYGFYNLSSTAYVAVFLSDGSVQQVNVNTSATTQILPAGSITSPAIVNMGMTQSGSQYLIIVANQTNGYWLWDGINLYASGTLSPVVVLTNVGAGYVSPPTVVAVGGSGHGATFVATIGGGVVTGVSITNPGTGYLATDQVSLVFSGGTLAGTGGTLSAFMTHQVGGSAGSLTMSWQGSLGMAVGTFIPQSISIINAGTGYGSLAQATFSLAPGTSWNSGAAPVIDLSEGGGGAISAVSLTPNAANPQMRFSNAAGGNFIARNGTPVGQSTLVLNLQSGAATPGRLIFDYNNPLAIAYGVSVVASSGGGVATVTISSPVTSPGVAIGDGIVTAGTAAFPNNGISDTGYFFVSAVSVNAAGSGYGPNIMVGVTGGTPLTPAVITPNVSGGSIISANIIAGGIYSTSVAPTLTVTDSASNASGSLALMPFGISGNAVQTYQGRVWVIKGAVVSVSAPGSVTNFATSAGGVQIQSTDNFLKIGYVNAVQTNGFLFLIGDNSMNYISGVQTTGTPPTTTFTNNNSDPEVGTPYPASITTLGTDILLANSAGIFVSSGGAFNKRSEPLDGVYFTVANFNGQQLSAAKATIFGKRVWMVLVPIVDPVSGSTVNKLLMYNGQVWWSSMQDVTLTFIAGQEINSVYTAWGTDGTHIYPLFKTPSTAFGKLAQTKLWDSPGMLASSKSNTRFWALLDYYNISSSNLLIEVDAIGIDSTQTQFNTAQTYTITGPSSIGYFNTPVQAVGQQGILTGLTIKTSCADVALIVAMMDSQMVQYRG